MPPYRRALSARARFVRRLATLPFRIARLLLLVIAGTFGPVRPQFVRHQDDSCQVAESGEEREP